MESVVERSSSARSSAFDNQWTTEELTPFRRSHRPWRPALEKLSSSHISESPPTWVLDEASDHCGSCQVAFSLLRRRHHCRSCGLIFCYACSAVRITMPELGYDEPVRCCTSCSKRRNSESDATPSGGA